MRRNIIGFLLAVVIVGRRFQVASAVIMLVILLTGCATTIETAPFQLFSQTVEYTGKTMDKVIHTTGDLFKDEFIRDFAANSDTQLSELKLKTTGDLSREIRQDSLPLFMQIGQSRVALILLNEALNSYAELLLQLANDKLLTPKMFSQLEKSLNRSVTTVFKTLIPEQKTVVPEILSQTAGDLMRHYLESKRRSYLVEAIRENHHNIEAYSMLVREIVLKCRNDIKRYYTNETARMSEQWVVATKADKQKDREKLARAMVALNTQFINTLDLLEALDNAYAALPMANADLAIAVELPGTTLANLERFQQASRLIKALQQ